jgi:hypothetical protein
VEWLKVKALSSSPSTEKNKNNNKKKPGRCSYLHEETKIRKAINLPTVAELVKGEARIITKAM